MELKEFRERLQSVGRNRLCNRPGAYPRFEHWAGTTRGVISTTAAILCMPSTLPFAERMGSVEATRRINERLAEIVDEWEQSHGPTHAIEPLPQVAIARMGAQDDAKPAPAGNSAASPPVKKRRDLLAPLIEEAQKQCEHPQDAPAVWIQLSRLAEARTRPLLGVCDEGIKWQDANDEVKFLSLKNLRDRLGRCKAR